MADGLLVPGVLKILVQGAQDLGSVSQQQQPYYVLECGGQRSRSKPCASSARNPVWNSAHKFALADEVVARVTVKDEVSKDLIGEALIDLSRARARGRDDSAAPLTTLGGHDRGLLVFKLKFTANPSVGGGNSSALPATPPSAGARAGGHGGGRGGGGGASEGSEVSYMSEGVSASARSSEGGAAALGDAGLLMARPQGSTAARGSSGGGGAAQPPGVARTRSTDDPTLRSVDSKVSMAKRAMQQLQAELAEMTTEGNDADGGVPGSPSARSTPSAAGSRGVGGGRSGGAGHANGGPSADELVEAYVDARDRERLAGDAPALLAAALAAAHAERAAADEELDGAKRSLAAMSSAHFLEVKRLRDAAAASGGASSRAARVSNDSNGPVAAHRLEIEVHQQAALLAEQAAALEGAAAAAAEHEAALEALRGELADARRSAATAEGNARAAEARAAEMATTMTRERARAEAADAGSKESSAGAAAAAAEVARVRADYERAAAERAELQKSLALLERSSRAELSSLQAALADAEQRAADGAKAAAEAAALSAQLDAARAQAARAASGADEVEYLQEQLRRTLRQVVELQHANQVLSASAAAAASAAASNGGAAAAASNDGSAAAAAAAAASTAMSDEHEFLMQELVTTKLELAELKEKQLVVTRSLSRAQESLKRSGSLHASGGNLMGAA